MARVLAVASGKGGVGKTTVTVNLALALHALGARVGISRRRYLWAERADAGCPPAQGRAGLCARGAAQEAEPYIPPLERFGLTIMSMGLIVAEDQVINPLAEVAGQVVVETLRSVQWDRLDYLLLDLPALGRAAAAGPAGKPGAGWGGGRDHAAGPIAAQTRPARCCATRRPACRS